MMAIDSTAADIATRAGTLRSSTSRSLELIRACRTGPDGPIITVGDMDPQLLVALRLLGHEDLTVLHPSLDELQKLRESLGDLEREVLLIEADVLSFQPRRSYALWHDSGFFHRLRHADDRQRYVQLVQFALRPEGHLIISTAGPEEEGRDDGGPVERYSASLLVAELGRQFELEEHAIAMHTDEHGRSHELLHCRFQRHAQLSGD
jgi:hypothetical protein